MPLAAIASAASIQTSEPGSKTAAVISLMTWYAQQFPLLYAPQATLSNLVCAEMKQSQEGLMSSNRSAIVLTLLPRLTLAVSFIIIMAAIAEISHSVLSLATAASTSRSRRFNFSLNVPLPLTLADAVPIPRVSSHALAYPPSTPSRPLTMFHQQTHPATATLSLATLP